MADVAGNPPPPPPQLRQPGALRGRIVIADDFDELPPELAEYA